MSKLLKNTCQKCHRFMGLGTKEYLSDLYIYSDGSYSTNVHVSPYLLTLIRTEHLCSICLKIRFEELTIAWMLRDHPITEKSRRGVR